MRRHRRLAVQAGWMLLIWSLSVGGLLLASSAMRWMMRTIGMAS